ncbi:exopolyphosphatase/guanosine-5'-triphosphate,3'-diphosphate pyrophosphatase [Deinobacterium chartae]|uniref:Exopolyphosphatase/guanosine-5'-triphosphate, 3'-diphosphate pyrophosphatase n=1 Tax=Deinobacterium chartae TaxID=521158 RepID=A0A841I6R6_9DEIO|nr:Ppx/GppA phosphatase family protein [Deinobacterium chartae]MBB6100100.1 exopolyphosphatase/guanosine-5'-triphosphate,3'-diphosphate pyrophosphatase [Deinobacterium chartae]
MRVAIADVGTNSCHLLIAEFRAGQAHSYLPLDSYKERTRLGEHLEGGRLTEEGYERLKQALLRFKTLAEAAGARDLTVYATSAMREASNGLEVAERLRTETGVYPRIISGETEGTLTYLGVGASVELGARNLLLDLGGGSLELALGGPREAERVLSLPLGSVRMHRQFLHKDPPSPASLQKLDDFVRSALAPHLEAFRVDPSTRVIGSSGTFESIAAMLSERDGHGSRGLNGYTFGRHELEELYRELARLPLARRLRFPGLDPKRADIIMAGLRVVLSSLRALQAERVTVSTGALREGMLIDLLRREAAMESTLSPRQQSVLEVAERFSADLGHARAVATLARQLLAALSGTVAFVPEARSMLTAAATLHEVGYLVNPSSHHKHSAYLIRNAGLRGYEPWQIEVIAQVARYHRKSTPKPSHAEYAALPREQQQLVRQLAAVLRVADGLDRSHTRGVRIRRLQARADGYGWRLEVANATELDLRGAQEKSDLWNSTFGQLEIVAVRETLPEDERGGLLPG